MRVQPRASREGLGGLRQGALLVRLTAPPVEGAANAALLRFLGRALGLAPSSLELLRGQGGRDKLVLARGLTADAARTALLAALGR